MNFGKSQNENKTKTKIMVNDFKSRIKVKVFPSWFILGKIFIKTCECYPKIIFILRMGEKVMEKIFQPFTHKENLTKLTLDFGPSSATSIFRAIAVEFKMNYYIH